jgi:KaiC/GvpD/RAD55 family RecA-like ATPase
MHHIVPSGIDGLDRLVGGGFPKGSLIVIAGKPGTGKTILSAQFLYHGCIDYNECGAYVSFAEDKEQFYKNMMSFGFDFERLEKEGKFFFFDMITVKETGISTILESIISKFTELGVKRLVIDSFSAMAQAYKKPHDMRIVLHTILGKIVRSMGCTTFLIVEIPHRKSEIGLNVEEFVADGIIILKRSIIENKPLRILEILKMRGSPTPEARALFTLKDGFKVFLPFTYKTTERKNRFKPQPDTEGYFSTGSPDLDKMLGNGYPRGSTVLIEIDKRISVLQHHLICMTTARNFMSQGRGVIKILLIGADVDAINKYAITGGLTIDELNDLMRICVKYYSEPNPEPYIVTLSGKSLMEVYRNCNDIGQELRSKTKQPILWVTDVDALINIYGERKTLWFLRMCIARTKYMKDLNMVLLRQGYPKVAEILGSLTHVHLKIIRKHGTVLIYGIKPRTNVHVLEMDVSEGYPMPKLTPVI